ncbi:MAG: rRNA methyltransferase [Cyclobacteriaceae bacterium]|nr:rRNA methyltransferase [Cyclobacteriaceae bacterium]
MGNSEIQLPEDFFNAMQDTLGESFPDFINSFHQEPLTSIRLNPQKPFEQKLNSTIPWCSTGFYLEQRPVFTLDPCFHAGAYYVQEASSMFLEQVFRQLNLDQDPICILDVSAAPGGKSTHLASLMHRESLLVANEVIRSRASILHENITKWGTGNVMITNNDPDAFGKLPGFFDMILVDAPCSGEGLFRKDANAMQEWSLEHVAHCSKRQRRILNDVWPALKTDGLLVYSTCTYNRFENEENIQWLTEQHGIESLPLKIEKHWGIEEVKYKNLYGYRFYPHKLNGEGFFISVLQKKEQQQTTTHGRKSKTSQPPQTILAELQQWIQHPEDYDLELSGDRVIVSARKLAVHYKTLKDNLKVVSYGTPIATIKGNKLIPEHELALATLLNQPNFRTIDLTLEQALAFLRKENIRLNIYEKGFSLATYKGLPLGWMNVLDNRVNNLYPKAWRIRMKG